MIQVIFVPVLFLCMNDNCEFMQAQTWFKTEQQCRTALESQKDNLRKMALKGSATITQIEGTCIIVRNGLL